MDTKLKMIGNSKGIIIPAGIIKVLDIKENDKLNIEIQNEAIILRKAEAFNPKSLEELFEGFSGDHQGEIVFDDAKGKEVW